MAGELRGGEKAESGSQKESQGIRYRGRRHEKFLPGNGDEKDQARRHCQESV